MGIKLFSINSSRTCGSNGCLCITTAFVRELYASERVASKHLKHLPLQTTDNGLVYLLMSIMLLSFKIQQQMFLYVPIIISQSCTGNTLVIGLHMLPDLCKGYVPRTLTCWMLRKSETEVRVNMWELRRGDQVGAHTWRPRVTSDMRSTGELQPGDHVGVSGLEELLT